MLPFNAFAATAVLIVLTAIYSYLIFELIDKILRQPRLKKLWRIPVGMFNVLLGLGLTQIFHPNSLTAYLILLAVFIINFALLYRDTLAGVLLCALACSLHFMCLRAMVTAGFSIYYSLSLNAVVGQTHLFLWSIIITLVSLCVCITVVLCLIPFREVRIINQHDNHVWFLVAWLGVFNVYMLINSIVYSVPETHSQLALNQLVAPVVILLGLYILLFFSMTTAKLLGYKEHSDSLAEKMDAEKRYRDSMLKDAIATYEFNCTQDKMLSGFEQFAPILGNDAECYSIMVENISRQVIHPDDVAEYLAYASRSNALSCFERGITEAVIDYRRLAGAGRYQWVRSITNLVRDPKSGDITGFSYVKDIDEQKRLEIDLQFKAQRDSLTSLYNKGTTQKLIEDYLAASGATCTGALFMVDVDNFKAVNDNLGHTYGDAVLCELASKLQQIFRDNDIVGRIGGDEFIAFMRGAHEEDVVRRKALEMCTLLQNFYGSEDASYEVSVSVGVAMFPRDGHSFETLYERADIALYEAKSAGKNTFCLYHGNTFGNYQAKRTEFDVQGAAQKNFSQNRIEYVFKILFETSNVKAAIQAVLELVTIHFHFDRGYIFETSPDGKFTSNTFEWVQEGISSEIDGLQNVPIAAVATAMQNFKESGMFIVEDIRTLPEVERAVLEPQGIRSMFQFGLFDGATPLGFLGFDHCHSPHIPTPEQIEDILTICNILSTFFVKQRITERATKSFHSLENVLNQLSIVTYVIDRRSFEVLFMNQSAANLLGERRHLHQTCYQLFRGEEAPCKDCPARLLTPDSTAPIVREVYSKPFDIWLEATASNLIWADDAQQCLLSCVDITKYKNK